MRGPGHAHQASSLPLQWQAASLVQWQAASLVLYRGGPASQQLAVAVDLAPGDSLGYALLAEAQCGREHQPSPHHKPRRGSVTACSVPVGWNRLHLGDVLAARATVDCGLGAAWDGSCPELARLRYGARILRDARRAPLAFPSDHPLVTPAMCRAGCASAARRIHDCRPGSGCASAAGRGRGRAGPAGPWQNDGPSRRPAARQGG